MSDPLKISEMTSQDEDYNLDATRTDVVYDDNTGGIITFAPIAFHGTFLVEGSPTGFSGDFDERSALPIVQMGERDIAATETTVPASLNKKTSAIGLMRHHLSNRRRVMKTNFECAHVSSDLDPFKIVTLNNDGFFIDDVVVQNRYLLDRAWLPFGYVTAGLIDIPTAPVATPPPYLTADINLKPVGRRKLKEWGDRIRFGVSLFMPLALDSVVYGGHISNNMLINVGFGSFLSTLTDESIQPDDTAASHGLCVNVRNGRFYIDWKYSGDAAQMLSTEIRQGSYDTGILAATTSDNNGECSIVFDIDRRVGMKITIAAATGEIYTLNFPLLDPRNQGLGMTWIELFNDGGISSLPTDGASIGQLNDDYYQICCIMQEFLNDDGGRYDNGWWSSAVAFGMSRQQYELNTTNDSGLSAQMAAFPDFVWSEYDPATFHNMIEIKAMYFESEFDQDATGVEAYGNRFNLALLGRESLRELDKFVESGGNAQYPE